MNNKMIIKNMALDLKNKKVLITGSTDGLGKQLAIALSKLGSKIIIHGRDKDKAESVLKELEGEGHSILICDFNEPKEIESKFSTIKELDILINNTGGWSEVPTIEITTEKIIEMVNVNTLSYLLVSRTLLPVLLKSEYSQILNVISVAGYEVPTDYSHTTYSATKYALQGYSEAMEKEFYNKNLRVMGYYPGGMNTNMFKKEGLDYKDNEPWMFDKVESVEAIIFMLTRNRNINIKRMDLIKHLEN
ncbi:SDR family oxidoreductase [Candidatus Dojkabacteria bacterium]|jgi:short-subunit dehydrogenase|nr:SDR family oxidoreductase [Candidatus Dojkabacteria bacterium]